METTNPTMVDLLQRPLQVDSIPRSDFHGIVVWYFQTVSHDRGGYWHWCCNFDERASAFVNEFQQDPREML
jgi:hypothetical protein